jgi:hypothetical protein
MALPLQILPQEENILSRLGTGLGAGIGAGLQNLAKIKLNELSQRQQAAQAGKFWQDLGLPPSIGSLPAPVQKGILDRLEGISLGGQQPQGMQALQQALPGQEAVQTSPVLGPNPVERRHRETLKAEESKVEQRREEAQQKQMERAYTATKDIRKQIVDDKRTAEKDINSITHQEELEKSGNLISPGYYSALKKVGLDIPALLGSPESEAYIKSTQQFLGNARQVYGGRVTNFELEQFMKSIATLENTPKGRKIILEQMKNLAQAKIARYNAMEKILADNKGVPPFDLNEQIERVAGKKLDKLSKKFTRSIDKITGTPSDNFTVMSRRTSQPTEEGTKFRKAGSNEVMIIRNGQAVPFEG